MKKSAVAPARKTQDGTVYTLVGSQFGAKVITALDAVGIGLLDPPHTVPQMDWRGKRLTDSADILKAIDSGTDGKWKLYPEAQRAAVEQLEQRIGHVVNAYVMYFTWWVKMGFWSSYGRVMARDLFRVPLPLWLGRRLLPCAMPLGRVRGSMRKRVRKILGEQLITPGREPAADEEDKMRAALVRELRALDERLAGGPPAPERWLCGTAHPSAADFALYACLERLVGDSGDANMGAAAPWLFAEAHVAELQAWHARMVALHPIRFRGKTGAVQVWR
eukprot:g7364.t1